MASFLENMNNVLATKSYIPLNCNLKSSCDLTLPVDWPIQKKCEIEAGSPKKIKISDEAEEKKLDHLEDFVVTEEDFKLEEDLIFKDCQIVLDLPSSLPLSIKQKLRKKIINNGGQISYAVTKNAKILITAGMPGSTATQSLKQKTAVKFGIPVVTEDYIDACIAQQKLLDCKPFLLLRKHCSDAFQKGKIIAENKSKAAKSSGFGNKTPLALVPVHSYDGLEGYELIKAVLLKGRTSEKHSLSHTNKDDKILPFAFCVLELHALSSQSIDDSHKFCVFTHEGILTCKEIGKSAEFGTKKCRYLQTVEAALSVYSQLYWKMTEPPQSMQQSREILHPGIGSPAFRKLQVGWSLTMPSLEPPVLYLVDLIWTEAVGKLTDFLTLHPSNIPVWKVDEAEGILLQINSILKDEHSEEILERLTKEFYSILPHHTEHQKPIVNARILSQKFDLCQVLRDMVTVSEASGWAPKGHLQAKHRSLHCHVNYLDPESSEFCNIQEMVINSQTRDTHIKVQNIFQVQRDLEPLEFTQQLPNCQLMFHSTSPSNLVGILSRGLLLPRVVTEEHGVSRTDAGMLGSGIYFANAASTCVKYSKTNQKNNTRFLLICKVALGCTYQTKKINPNLTSPPEGFQSIHGVKSTEKEPSDFIDDEFVIFSPSQQQMCYLVEFSLPEDEKVVQQPWLHQSFLSQDDVQKVVTENDTYMFDTDISDITDTSKQPATCKLQGISDSSTCEIPLKEVHVVGHLIDLVAKVIVYQVYENSSSQALEARYVFPLETGAAVCGFEAYINGKHIIGEVKEKKKAHEEYTEAIKQGHGAYLMDEDSHDVFTVSVGNLPPNATVIIRISYVMELPVEGDLIRFSIPVGVAPCSKEKALNQQIQDTTGSVAVQSFQKFSSVRVNVQMPFVIQKIYSPSHQIKLKKTDTKAVVEMTDSDSSGDFNLLISLAEVHMPRMWLERHPEKQSQACMLTFFPEIESPENTGNEIVLLIDASNSMKGTAFQDALKVSLLCLKLMPSNAVFNIVAFGSVFQELFPSSQLYNQKTLDMAEVFLKSLAPNLGNTELFHSLHSYHTLAGNHLTNLLLITDGHINSEGIVVHNVGLHSSHVRIFTLGISTTANKHLLKKLAHDGSGAYEYFDPSFKHDWKKKVQSQLEKTAQPAITNVCVEWQNANTEGILQAPRQIMSLFSGCRQVVYGFVSNCTMATLRAEIDGNKLSTVVSTSELHETSDTILHTLTARAIISDWEYGILAEDRLNSLVERKNQERQVIELSKEYSLVTSLTSFIAVEERNESIPSDSSESPDIHTLLAEEGDILSYMTFDDQSSSRKLYSKKKMAQSFCRAKRFIRNIDYSSEENDKSDKKNGEDFELLAMSIGNLREEIFLRYPTSCSLPAKIKKKKTFTVEESLSFPGRIAFGASYCYASSLNSVQGKGTDQQKLFGEASQIHKEKTIPFGGPALIRDTNLQLFSEPENFRDLAPQFLERKTSLTRRRMRCRGPDETCAERATLQADKVINNFESEPLQSDFLLKVLSDDDSSHSESHRLYRCNLLYEDFEEVNDVAPTHSVYLHSSVISGIMTDAICSIGGGLPLCKSFLRNLKKEDVCLQRYFYFKILSGSLPTDFSTLQMEQNGIKFSVEDIMLCQDEDGSWSEENCLKFGLTTKQMFQELENVGLNSLGKKAAHEIRRLVSTITVVLFILCRIVCFGCRQEPISSSLEILAEELAYLSVSQNLHHPLRNAVLFSEKMDAKHPLVYSTLGLGKSWEGFILPCTSFPSEHDRQTS